eukprot:389621-Rhodomonas_salina.1
MRCSALTAHLRAGSQHPASAPRLPPPPAHPQVACAAFPESRSLRTSVQMGRGHPSIHGNMTAINVTVSTLCAPLTSAVCDAQVPLAQEDLRRPRPLHHSGTLSPRPTLDSN